MKTIMKHYTIFIIGKITLKNGSYWKKFTNFIAEAQAHINAGIQLINGCTTKYG